MNLERSGDRAVDIFPSDVYDTSSWVCESRESIREEIKVVCTAPIAVMLFPEGPVTDTHAPQLAELSQLESDKAVPKMPEGRV